MSQVLRRRMEWVEGMRCSLLRALGEGVVHDTFTVLPTVDPIKVILTIPLRRSLNKQTRELIRIFIREWGMQNNCEMPNIVINDRQIRALVLTKVRFNPDTQE